MEGGKEKEKQEGERGWGMWKREERTGCWKYGKRVGSGQHPRILQSFRDGPCKFASATGIERVCGNNNPMGQCFSCEGNAWRELGERGVEFSRQLKVNTEIVRIVKTDRAILLFRILRKIVLLQNNRSSLQNTSVSLIRFILWSCVSREFRVLILALINIRN